VAVGPNDNLATVCEALQSHIVRRVLVIDPTSQTVLGIIGWADIAPVLTDRAMGRIVKNAVLPA
jgi:hypothetical protein